MGKWNYFCQQYLGSLQHSPSPPPHFIGNWTLSCLPQQSNVQLGSTPFWNIIFSYIHLLFQNQYIAVSPLLIQFMYIKSTLNVIFGCPFPPPQRQHFGNQNMALHFLHKKMQIDFCFFKVRKHQTAPSITLLLLCGDQK